MALTSIEEASASIDYNPFLFEVQHNPYPVYKRMRDEAPVYRHPELGFYALTRYVDVLNVFESGWEPGLGPGPWFGNPELRDGYTQPDWFRRQSRDPSWVGRASLRLAVGRVHPA